MFYFYLTNHINVADVASNTKNQLQQNPVQKKRLRWRPLRLREHAHGAAGGGVHRALPEPAEAVHSQPHQERVERSHFEDQTGKYPEQCPNAGGNAESANQRRVRARKQAKGRYC